MTSSDETITVLKEIRDGVRATNARLDQTNARLDQTNTRLDQTRRELGSRLERVENRVGGVEVVLLELSEQQRFVVRGVRSIAERELRLDGEVADLRQRVEVLEAKVDPP